jgi:cell division septation protein DedD
MMTSLLNLEFRAVSESESREVPEQEAVPQPSSASADYEIVLGRSQIASWLFMAVIAVAICSSLAYLTGERIANRKTATHATASTQGSSSASAQFPQASILVAPQADVASFAKNDKLAAPLLAEPEIGKVYIQIAAVERGMATLLAVGLRSHGFDSFVAAGPNDKLFRVLIGPLPDPAAFRKAMVTVNALDLASFARKYQK